MKAIVRSVRIAPKKANLIARMVRGLTVPDATEQLRRTNKKAARIVELLLRSAVANASHNDKQDPQTMVIKTIVVNQGTAYHRGMPMARGRQRPFRKFLSHITLTLGFSDDVIAAPTKKKQAPMRESKKTASQKAKTAVKTPGSPKGGRKAAGASSPDASTSSVSTAS